jgi:hypothetical protein
VSRVGDRATQVTARRDLASGELDVDVDPPGPAGAVTLELADGLVEILVDVAEPTNLLALHAEDPDDDRARQVIELLLGPMASARAARVGADDAVVWNREADEPETTLARGARRGTAPGGLGLIGRTALSTAEAAGPLVASAAEAVGLVEAGILALDLAVGLGIRPDPLAIVRAGMSRWHDLDDDEFDHLVPFAREIVDRGERWSKVLGVHDPDAATELVALLAELRDQLQPYAASAAGAVGPPGAGVRAEVASDMATPAAAPVAGGLRSQLMAVRLSQAAEERPSTPTIRLGPELVPSDARLVRTEFERNHLTVHVSGLPEWPKIRDGRHGRGIWLRVFEDRGDEALPLAMAPFDGGGFRWRTAIAILPEAASEGRLLVDVTTNASSPWDSEATHRLRSAFELGAHAARRTRRGDARAPEDWDRAADAWDEMGDEAHAEQARTLAYPSAGHDPLITDLLSEI